MNQLIRDNPSFGILYKKCVDQRKYLADAINDHLLDTKQTEDWIEIEIHKHEADRVNAMSEEIEEIVDEIADDLGIYSDEVWQELKLFVQEMKEAH